MDSKSAIRKMKTKPVRCVGDNGVEGWSAPGGVCHVGFNAKQKARDDASSVRVEGKAELDEIERQRVKAAETKGAKRSTNGRG